MFSFWRPPSSSSTALVILGGVQCTNMKVRHLIAILYFIIVVVLLLSHLHCVIDNVTRTIGFHGGHFSQQDWNGFLMHCHWAVSLCVLWFHWKLDNSGARDVSAVRTLPYTVTECFVIWIFVVVHRVSTFAVYNPLTSLRLSEMTLLIPLSTVCFQFAASDNVFSDIVSAQEDHLFPRWSSVRSHETDSYSGWVLVSFKNEIFEYGCLSLTAFCSPRNRHRIMHLKKSFHQWLGALVVMLGWRLLISVPPCLANKLKLKQSGSTVNILSLRFAISSPVSSMLRLLPITHKDSSFQWYHHRV